MKHLATFFVDGCLSWKHLASNGNEMTAELPPKDNTEIRFDLRSVCSQEEVEQFRANAEKAGAKDLTEHFVNLALRKEEAA